MKKQFAKATNLLVLVALITMMSLGTGCGILASHPPITVIVQVHNGMAAVSRGGGMQYAVIDVLSGEEIIPFGKYRRIIDLYDRWVVVVRHDRETDVIDTGVIDIKSREEVIPFGRYTGIRFLGEGLAAVTSRQVVYDTVIDIVSGEIILELSNRSVGRNVSDGMIVIGSSEVIKVQPPSGSELNICIIPPGRYEGIGEEIKNGMITTIGNRRLGFQDGITELSTGQELIPRGIYREVSLRQNGLAVVMYEYRYDCKREECQGVDCDIIGNFRGFEYANVRCGSMRSFSGLIDVMSGEELIPIGKFSGIDDVQDGMAVVWQRLTPEAPNTGRSSWRLIDIDSGELIISQDINQYAHIRLFEDGIVALFILQNGWAFYDIESLRLSYGEYE